MCFACEVRFNYQKMRVDACMCRCVDWILIALGMSCIQKKINEIEFKSSIPDKSAHQFQAALVRVTLGTLTHFNPTDKME